MINIAIVGGGPGGLMTAWHLDRKLEHECKVTIFEATDRLGGKIVSRKFDKVDALYEASPKSTATGTSAPIRCAK
jgi:protoporphyrinogen oxidase